MPPTYSSNQESESRQALSRELENLRSSIQNGQLVLFVGEQMSVLSARKSSKPTCSIDDWWEVVDNGSEVRNIYTYLVNRSF